MSNLEIAIVQQAPIHLNLKATVDKVLQIISRHKSADLIVFGETWLTGYPAWLDHGSNLNVWNGKPLKDAYSLLLQNSPSLQDHFISLIQKAARDNDCWVFIGIT